MGRCFNCPVGGEGDGHTDSNCPQLIKADAAWMGLTDPLWPPCLALGTLLSDALQHLSQTGRQTTKQGFY